MEDIRDLESADCTKREPAGESQCAVAVGTTAVRGSKAEKDTGLGVVVAQDHYFAFDSGSTHLQMRVGNRSTAVGPEEWVFAPLLATLERSWSAERSLCWISR